jgi:superoxide dismutase, Fe-Mn family
MAFELPPLPFEYDALESKGMSKETFEYHHDKHHATYVKTLNDLVAGTENEGKSLEEVIKGADAGPLFNNAAQHWNHSFFWDCLSPNGGGAPSGEVGDAINSAFGSYDKFAEEFSTAAKTQFGSGWAWLVDDGGLKVVKTANADLPLAHDTKALLTIDVWEHAYYIDFRNARPDFIKNFLDNLVNWDFVAKNLSS